LLSGVGCFWRIFKLAGLFGDLRVVVAILVDRPQSRRDDG
jgi:hypothetical protein